MNQSDIQKSIKQMQAEIQQLESRIEKRKSKEKSKSLYGFQFFTPFIKAVILTAIVLLMYLVGLH